MHVRTIQVAGKAIAGEEEDPALDRSVVSKQTSTSAAAATPPAWPAARPAQHSLSNKHASSSAAASAPSSTLAGQHSVSAPSRLIAARRHRMAQLSSSTAPTNSAAAAAASGKIWCPAELSHVVSCGGVKRRSCSMQLETVLPLYSGYAADKIRMVDGCKPS